MSRHIRRSTAVVGDDNTDGRGISATAARDESGASCSPRGPFGGLAAELGAGHLLLGPMQHLARVMMAAVGGENGSAEAARTKNCATDLEAAASPSQPSVRSSTLPERAISASWERA